MMDGQMCKVTVDGSVRGYPAGTSYSEIAADFQERYDSAIVLAVVDYKLQELNRRLKRDCSLSFLTLKDTAGHKSYKRSACLLLIKSLYDVLGHERLRKVKVEFSLSHGYYCSVFGDFTLDEELLDRVKGRMREVVRQDIPIEKSSYSKDEAVRKFHLHGMADKEKLFRYRRGSRVNIYNLSGFEDYYYGYMLPSSGYIRYFDLYLYDEGLVLQLPARKAPEIVPPFQPAGKLFQTMKESTQWGARLGIDTVGALNDEICRGNISEIILVQEALQESRISAIASDIVEKRDRKFIMIAGPSSSGKTTFSHRLSIQLKAHGLRPHPIGIDDYFVEREKTPKDKDGNYNFECLGAIDIEQFNRDMTNLLKGKTVELPTFNFMTGRREYRGRYKTLGPEDVLVIEGIHGLNDQLSHTLPRDSKYKIYISALTQLNVDEHNRIPTTDGRLLRRLVRDYRTRGASAQRTLSMWQSVRRGEEEYIFPFQEEADAMFNSALIYELSVLKQFAEPLLFGIGKEEPDYLEAQRLLKFLEYFLGVSSENIPVNSIIREFVGGSCFRV